MAVKTNCWARELCSLLTFTKWVCNDEENKQTNVQKQHSFLTAVTSHLRHWHGCHESFLSVKIQNRAEIQLTLIETFIHFQMEYFLNKRPWSYCVLMHVLLKNKSIFIPFHQNVITFSASEAMFFLLTQQRPHGWIKTLFTNYIEV